MPSSVSSPVGTAPVLAILVCHNGQRWLPEVLEALGKGTVRPQHVLAVDTGSCDDTPALLAEAEEERLLDGVLTLPQDTGYAAAVTAAVDAGVQRWDDPGAWLWLLHDDSAPEPECLDALLRAAETSSSVAVLGPVALDWSDPELVVGAGVSTDASGHRWSDGLRRHEARGPEHSIDVLAVPSAGALISRAVWDDLGGLDTEIPLLREDLDFGWRANASGRGVRCVAGARMRHAYAMTTRGRHAHAVQDSSTVVDRVQGVRTVLANMSTVAFVLGLPRLSVLCLLRGLGFVLAGKSGLARAEFAAAASVLGGVPALRAARARRSHPGSVPGLFIGRGTRLHAAVRRAVRARAGGSRPARPDIDRFPVRAPGLADVFAPPAVLVVVLTGVALALNVHRLSLDLAGGALLPVGDLGQVWSEYLGDWHAVAGGTASAAPVALAVLGIVGAPLAPFGGPAAVVSLLILADVVLAGFVAYVATRRVRASRWSRAAVAAAYGLLPAATAGAAQGRLDVVVAHLLLPAVLAGAAAVLRHAGVRWLSVSVLTALALAVLAAFAPAGFVLLAAGLLTGFGVLPAPDGRPVRRALAVMITVLLPLALLAPWLPVLATRLTAVVHGLGGQASTAPTVVELLGLDPGGTGALPVGVVLVAAAVVALVARPGRGMLPGLGVTVLGAVGAVVLSNVRVEAADGAAAPGFAGVPLLITGAGLLAVVLAAFVPRAQAGPAPEARWKPALVRPYWARAGAAGTAVAVLVLAAGAVFAGEEGPVRAGGGTRLAPSLSAELAATGHSVLVLGDVVRQTAGRFPHFGDDAIMPADGRARSLRDLGRGVLRGSRDAVTKAAASGVAFVVLPAGADGGVAGREVPDLVSVARPTTDGRTVLRLTPASAPVSLLSSGQARRALSGRAPSVELMRSPASTPVDARIPDLAVRVSEGGQGRLLVLASRYETGWSATVDGVEVPIHPAWGSQVAVSVPGRASEVTVSYDSRTHDLLLLSQVAALLFTALTSVPTRRPPTRRSPVLRPPSRRPASSDSPSAEPSSRERMAESVAVE